MSALCPHELIATGLKTVLHFLQKRRRLTPQQCAKAEVARI